RPLWLRDRFQRAARQREQQQLVASPIQVGIRAPVGSKSDAAAIRRPDRVLHVEIADRERRGDATLGGNDPEVAALLAQEAGPLLPVAEASHDPRRPGRAGLLPFLLRYLPLRRRLRPVEEGDLCPVR